MEVDSGKQLQGTKHPRVENASLILSPTSFPISLVNPWLGGGGGDALAAPASGWDLGGEDAVSDCGANGSSPAEDVPLPTQQPCPSSLLPRVQAQPAENS